jgi:hypothetical protein
MDGYLEVECLCVDKRWEKPQYIGYAELEKILVGYVKKEY